MNKKRIHITTIPDAMRIIAKKYELYEEELLRNASLKNGADGMEALKELEESTKKMQKVIKDFKSVFEEVESFQKVKDKFI